ncbi:SUKH-4 family immunity protein [Streptomyces sp. YGL11-2]|uniref:SUKH-4 family immunity protein n=1 Tax=Streptomyces sp. YGL11-2 TaxID=3414028 RepID=UPI003CF0BB5F
MNGYGGGSGPGPGAPGGAGGCRWDAVTLPPGLTHEPSRRFLVAHGLPEEAAGLHFTAVRDRRLKPLRGDGATRETGVATVTPGSLLLLGDDYDGEAQLALDGASGGVYLVAEQYDGWHRDLLASGLPELAGLAREIEAVSAPPDDPDPYGGRRGPAVVAEVRRRAEERMRRIDPELFAGPTPPAHWPTALLIRTLHWGAKPGAAGELAYVLCPELVAEIGDDGRVRRFTPDELPPQLTHEPTRRLLTEIGLPCDTDLFTPHEGPLRTMAEAHPDVYGDRVDDTLRTDGDDPPRRDHQQNFLSLGWWPHDLAIALDGATGRVELPDWYDDGDPAAYLHRDVSALLYACWTYGRLHAEWARWDLGAGGQPGGWAVFTPASLLVNVVDDMVRDIDPEAFATSRHSWRQLAEDDHTGGLLC